MDITKVVANLIKGLQEQGYSFESSLHASSFEESFSYQSGAKKIASNILQFFNKNFISYDNIDKASFIRDYNRFQQGIDERMLFTWAYKSATLSIIGIIHADELSVDEIRNIFTKLDSGMLNIMRKYVGQVNGQDYGTYGTMFLVFTDASKARNFNAIIKDYYSSHFSKCTYISTITVDCVSQILTQGKAGLFTKWSGGMDVSALKKKLFM